MARFRKHLWWVVVFVILLVTVLAGCSNDKDTQHNKGNLETKEGLKGLLITEGD
jgi:uncharacterized lipoprotein YehR (DUF1307 family)